MEDQKELRDWLNHITQKRDNIAIKSEVDRQALYRFAKGGKLDFDNYIKLFHYKKGLGATDKTAVESALASTPETEKFLCMELPRKLACLHSQCLACSEIEKQEKLKGS